jgi:hypothetical protein
MHPPSFLFVDYRISYFVCESSHGGEEEENDDLGCAAMWT